MKRIVGMVVALMVSVGTSWAMNHGGGHAGMAAGADHTKHKGELVREAMVDGHHLSYHLIDSKAAMEKSGAGHAGHGQMKSHHLMLYIMNAKGSMVTGGQVGYLVEAPGLEAQKAMTMEMEGGYGADVDFQKGKSYTVKTKIIAGGATLMDSFPFTLK